jgi:hypothetical protein
MISVYCDFYQFLATKLAFYLKAIYIMMKILQKLAVFLTKNWSFSAKIFQNHAIGPSSYLQNQFHLVFLVDSWRKKVFNGVLLERPIL